MKFFSKAKLTETPEPYFGKLPSWYAMVATNLAKQEILPYADMFKGRDRLTIFDCGANRGLWTPAAIETFPNAVIEAHLFEPSTKNCAFIRDRSHNLLYMDKQFETITVNECAVGETDTTLTLHADWEGSWLGSLVDRPDIAKGVAYDVPVVRLYSYSSGRNIAAIDLLKIDVEGWEMYVLKGGQRLFSANAIEAILFEFSSTNVFTRTFFYDFWQLLTPLGFKFSWVNYNGKMTPIETYEGRWELFGGTTLFFARRDRFR